MSTSVSLPQTVRKDDIGTKFTVTTVEDDVAKDGSLATTQELIFTKPDGTEVTQTSVFVTDGSDGKIRYVSVADDLDQVGRWRLRGHVILPTGDFRSIKGVFFCED